MIAATGCVTTRKKYSMLNKILNITLLHAKWVSYLLMLGRK